VLCVAVRCEGKSCSSHAEAGLHSTQHTATSTAETKSAWTDTDDAGYYSASTLNAAVSAAGDNQSRRNPAGRSQYHQQHSSPGGHACPVAAAGQQAKYSQQHWSPGGQHVIQYTQTELYTTQPNAKSAAAAALYQPAAPSSAAAVGDYDLAQDFEDDNSAQDSYLMQSTTAGSVDRQYSAVERQLSGQSVGPRHASQQARAIAGSVSVGVGHHDGGVSIGVGSDASYEQPIPVNRAMQSKPIVKRKTVSQGTTTSPTYDEIVNDQQDQDLTTALHDMMQQVGLSSMIVDRVELSPM
jgi:hypothetical protein